MSLLRLGINPDGSRHIVKEAPARARRTLGLSRNYFSGTTLQTESRRDRQLRMQRESMAKARAK